MKVLVIDNYDSFTFNLVQELGELGADLMVYRNDKITPEEARDLCPDGIVISPGPGRPVDAGVSNLIIETFAGVVPVLGVCLGHQCIGEVFGGSVGKAPALLHGKTSEIHHDGLGVFEGLSNPFTATRYHSLIVEDIPDNFLVTAHAEDGVVMGIRHPTLGIEGVQFHPESILTIEGPKLLGNFLSHL
jgi:anthranilate synthase/aminodeoxychorismate synthase-like glutamine amidotransferase